jgi:hypothetical protein
MPPTISATGSAFNDGTGIPRRAKTGVSPVSTRHTTSAVTDAMQLFQHKNNSRERGVKRGGQTGSRAGADQRLALPFARFHSKPSRNHEPRRTADLDRRAFTTQRHAAADACQAAKELHRQHAPPMELLFPENHGFHMGNAAARCFGRKTAHKPQPQPSSPRTHAQRSKQTPSRGESVKPGDAMDFRPLQRFPKG